MEPITVKQALLLLLIGLAGSICLAKCLPKPSDSHGQAVSS